MRVLCGLLLTALLLPALAGPAGAADADRAYEKARKAYYGLVDSPKKQKYRDQWLRVRDLFLAVPKADPAHPRSGDALYMAGKVSQGLYGISRLTADAQAAIEYFDRLARDYPGSSLADDGLFLAGTLLEETIGDQVEAYRRYQRIVQIYGDGDMAPKARAKQESLARYAPADKPSAPPVITSAPVDSPRSYASMVKGVRHQSYPEFTRVVVDLDNQADQTPRFLPADPAAGLPARLVVDLTEAGLSGDVPSAIALEDGRVGQVRVAQYARGVVRVVLDLSGSVDYQVFTLSNPYRVIVDVNGPVRQASTPPTPASAPPATTSSSGGGKTSPPSADGIAGVLSQTPMEPPPLRVQIPQGDRGKGPLRIVVDPGHGGKDPGAIGPSGIMEKDVTLAMAKLLARELTSTLGCEVVLTRDKDIYLPLDERTAIANRVGADLFISLHVNANQSSSPYGIETYYLNFSKNNKVMELAARENGTTLKEVGDLEMILLDLMANSKINESSRLAAEIQKSMVDLLSGHYSRIKDLGVRQGPFYVLLGATMPSVLVEAAFISNHREEARLVDSKYQQRTVLAIRQGVQGYLKSFSMIASQ